MHWLAGVVLGLVLAASAFLVVVGLVALFRRHWRASLATLLGLGVFLGYCVLLAAIAYALGPAQMDGTKLDPSEKARVLAEIIAEQMNISVWGLPLGLLLGVAKVVRSVRRAGRAA